MVNGGASQIMFVYSFTNKKFMGRCDPNTACLVASGRAYLEGEKTLNGTQFNANIDPVTVGQNLRSF